MKVNFILGTRANNDIVSPMVQAVEYTRAKLLSRGIFFYWEIIGGYSDPKNANLIMTHLVQSEAPYLILVDRDILFSPDMLYKLYKDLEEGYDFISGIYCLRNGIRLAGVPFKEPYYIDGTIQEFKYITSGFTGYSKKLLWDVKEKNNLQLCNAKEQDEYYPFCEEKSHGDALLGWDWDFCEKVHQVGFKSYVDTSIQVGHLGEKVYLIEDYLKYQEDFNKESAMDEDFYKQLKIDFSDCFNLRDEDIEHYMRLYGTAHESNMSWLDNNKDYYKDNLPFVCGLIAFNIKKETWETRYLPLEKLEGLKIFDLGCGIGTLAFWLSKKNKVTGYDICKQAIDFCEFKNKKDNKNVTFLREMPESLKEYDVVTSTDVLEHFKDLDVFLKELGTKMRSGAVLYHYDAFKDIDTFMHYDHSQNIDRWLKDVGFMPISKTWAVKQ